MTHFSQWQVESFIRFLDMQSAVHCIFPYSRGNFSCYLKGLGALPLEFMWTKRKDGNELKKFSFKKFVQYKILYSLYCSCLKTQDILMFKDLFITLRSIKSKYAQKTVSAYNLYCPYFHTQKSTILAFPTCYS